MHRAVLNLHKQDDTGIVAVEFSSVLFVNRSGFGLICVVFCDEQYNLGSMYDRAVGNLGAVTYRLQEINCVYNNTSFT